MLIYDVRSLYPGLKPVHALLAAMLLVGANPAAAQVVINEIDYDQPGTDTAEFIELYNAGGSAVDLDSYSLDLINGNGGASYATVDLPAVSLAAGDFYVVCTNVETVGNCDLVGISQIQNGAPDAVALRLSGVVTDTVSYEGDVPGFTEGSGANLNDDSSGGAGGPNEYKSISRIPDGADTDQNNVDFSHVCMSPGEPNLSTTSECQPPQIVAIVINEVDYDQPGVDAAEFLELFNSGNTPIDLDAYTVDFVNGANGSIYLTVDLPAVELVAGDYFVLCADPAAVAGCDLQATADQSFFQNGAPDAVALLYDGGVVDALSYEGDAIAPYIEGSGVGLEDTGIDIGSGLSRFPDGTDTDQNNVDFSVRCVTPGGPNTSVFTECAGGTGVEIFAIQGSGLASPLDGQLVTTNDNVVTAVGPEGFFIQTPAARSDGDPETSDGIYVYTGGAPGVLVGDAVNVTGFVDEFFDFTEIANSPLVTVTTSGNPLPSPVMLDAGTPSPVQPQPDNELERFEGMLVSFMGITTGPSDQFGDTPVTAQSERAFREPGIAFPGLPGLPVWDGNPEVFEIDADALGLSVLPLFGGQPVTAEGPLAFSFGDYIVWPTTVSAPPGGDGFPIEVRARFEGEFSIASQNMLRLFDTVDDPDVDDSVTSPADYAARLLKASEHVRVTLGAPDLIAFQEVENLGVLEDLAARIVSDDPSVDYDVYLLEGNDVGGIDVGYLVRPDTIEVLGIEQIGLNTLLSFDGSLLNDRPPLAIRFNYTAYGEPFPVTVVNVHQRSLGGIEGNEATRVKTKRQEQAVELAEWIAAEQQADPSARLVVIGDFNAFEFTDGYVDVLGQISGSPDPLGAEFPASDIVDPDLVNQTLSLLPGERYTFVFNGSAQVLDHALTSETLEPFVSGYQISRGNADSPASLLLETTPGTTGLRIADHDGMVLYIDSDFDADGVANSSDNCLRVANADQRDTNEDGFGNLCDADLTDNCSIGFDDLAVMRSVFFTSDPDADFNGNGTVAFDDLALMQDTFFGEPGPSGVPNICE